MNVPGMDRMWPLVTRGGDLHVRMYRRSGGRIGGRFFFVGRQRIALVDHVGARSGTHRTVALIYLPDGDDVVIVASKGGHPKHPAWFHNLKANPDTTVQVGGELRPVTARVATAAERERLWPLLVDLYPSYADYQRKADREIPVVILRPRGAGVADSEA